MKKLSILLFCGFLTLFLCQKSYAHYNPVITKYQLGIDVLEDKTFNIIENINAYFYEPLHGIYRTLPQKGVLKRKNGLQNLQK